MTTKETKRTTYMKGWREKNRQHYRDYQREYRRAYRVKQKAKRDQVEGRV